MEQRKPSMRSCSEGGSTGSWEPLLSSGEEEAEASLGRRGHCLKNKHSNNHDRKDAGRRKHNVHNLLSTSYSNFLFPFLFVLIFWGAGSSCCCCCCFWDRTSLMLQPSECWGYRWVPPYLLQIPIVTNISTSGNRQRFILSKFIFFQKYWRIDELCGYFFSVSKNKQTTTTKPLKPSVFHKAKSKGCSTPCFPTPQKRTNPLSHPKLSLGPALPGL